MLAGEAEGVMVIPRHLAVEVAVAAVERDLSEEFVMEKIRAGAPRSPPSTRSTYETKREYRAWKSKRANS